MEESTGQLQKKTINIYHLLIFNKLLTSSEHRNSNKPFYFYKGLIQWQKADPTSSYDQCTCMREMPFIYRGHQGPVPKGHLDWKWLNKMKLKSSSWTMYMEEIPLSFNGIYKVAVAVQRQRVLCTENSEFASGSMIGTFPRFVAIGFYFLSETLI